MTLENRHIYYGWWIVLGAFFGNQIGFTAVFYTFSVFLKPIAESLQWSRGQVSFSISIASFGCIVGAPFVGRLMDRYGVRPVVSVSTFLLMAGLNSFRFLPPKIGFLYTFLFLLGLTAAGTTLLPYTTLVSRWFEKRRGIALGIAAAGSSTGGFFLPPIFSQIIANLGWANAYGLLGFLSFFIMIPITLFLLKEFPRDLGLFPDGDLPGERFESFESKEKKVAAGLSWKEARRTRTFWLLAIGFFLMSGSINGSLIHLVPFLTDRGMETSRAVLFVSLLAGSSLAGRLISGYMADRWVAKSVAALFFGGAAAGTFVLWLGPGGGLLILAIFAVGLAFGAEVDLSAYLVGKCFGLGSFGEIYSYIYGIFVLGAVIGPAFAGILFDQTGSYDRVFLAFFGAMVASSLLMIPVKSEVYGEGSEKIALAKGDPDCLREA
jgi:MFS family permease